MLYEDNDGNLMHPEEVEALFPYEIEERGFHIFSNKYDIVV